MKKEFNTYIQKLIHQEDEFIYKNSLELLRLFYNKLYELFEDKSLCLLYLDQFDSIDKIKQGNIENEFSYLVLDYCIDKINDKEFVNFNESGVYFIYDDEDTLLYIGETNDLSSRPIESFINKIPYGAHYVKLIPFKSNKDIEAVTIDYFLPMYNNKKETVPNITNRHYTSVIELVKIKLESTSPIYPLIYE